MLVIEKTKKIVVKKKNRYLVMPSKATVLPL